MSALSKFIQSVCVQQAWYWAKLAVTPDGFGGATYPLPVLVKCRWDGKSQLVRDSMGQEVISVAEILVVQEMVAGDRITLITPGEDTDEYRQAANPNIAPVILTTSVVPMFRSTVEFVRTVYI